MLVAGSLYGCLLFSYLYLWIVSPQTWPGTGPALADPLGAALLLVLSSWAVRYAERGVARNGDCTALAFAVPLLAAAMALSIASHRDLSPVHSAYGAIVHAVLAIDGFFAAAAIVLALFALARRATGHLDRRAG
jgi:heme/copper-type cytochrome/quinol oxidase subunit 3